MVATGGRSFAARAAVQTVLGFLAPGDSVEDGLEEYPQITRAGVQACLDYASRVMANHFSVVQTARRVFSSRKTCPLGCSFRRIFQLFPFPRLALSRAIRRFGNLPET